MRQKLIDDVECLSLAAKNRLVASELPSTAGADLKLLQSNFRVNTVSEDLSSEQYKKRHFPYVVQREMIVMLEVDHPDGTREELHLCKIEYDLHGVLTISPDFNSPQSPYKISSKSSSDLFDYCLQLVSKSKLEGDDENEALLRQELLSSNLLAAKNFQADKLYVQYFVDLPDSKHYSFC
ncbi:Pleiotropic negative transcriptional regulator [Cichlidogyrus casuarinus]|uniref:Pleiotropic negative transcriptional regulator n=1 Tax=Cichlidogyrus casuarinus TaxID=1844966 RepID=A0ABD2PTY0_9PLAT